MVANTSFPSMNADEISDATSRAATRTMAVLAAAAAQVHRLAIIRHIQEHGFAILEERMEQWRYPEDTDFLSEFLACEADERKWVNRLTRGPIYVMVLERKSAAAMWNDLIGPETQGGDDSRDDFHTDASRDLRTKYGTDLFYGSPPAGAERQIAICFPELANDYVAADPFAPSDTVLIQADDILYDEEGRAFDANNGEELDLQEEIAVPAVDAHTQSARDESSKVFRARPLPASLRQASIQPRMSRAAALRMGIELPAVPRREPQKGAPNTEPTGISGLARQAIAQPKSLAQPTVLPRLNKAAAARLGQSAAESAAGTPPKSLPRERVPVDFSNTPGHKRASSGVKLASLQSPSIAPRGNKASAARAGAFNGSPGASVKSPDLPISPPTSTRTSFSSTRTTSMNRTMSITSNDSESSGTPRARKPVDFSNTPGHKRSISAAARPASLREPTFAPRLNKAAVARGSAAGISPGKENASPHRKATDFSNTPGHRRSSISDMPMLASLRPPSIVPRSNNAAEARLAAGGAVAGEGGRARPPSRSGSALGNHQRSGSALGTSSPSKMRTGGVTEAEATARPMRAKAPPSSYRHSMILPRTRPATRG